MEINWPLTNSTTTWDRNLGLPYPVEQRANHENRDPINARVSLGYSSGRYILTLYSKAVITLPVNGTPKISNHLDYDAYLSNSRNIMKYAFFFSEERSYQLLRDRVLSSTRSYRSVKWFTTRDPVEILIAPHCFGCRTRSSDSDRRHRRPFSTFETRLTGGPELTALPANTGHSSEASFSSILKPLASTKRPTLARRLANAGFSHLAYTQ